MRNRPVRRWAAALLNLLFLLAWGEPVSLHPCPMHDGAAVAAAVSHAAGHGGAAARAHGHHAPGAATHALPAHGTPTTDQGAHACQCLGECSVGAAAALPSAVAVEWQATIRHAAEPPLAEPATPRAAAPRLLPFANGPPSVA
jgi:hypothetical protein